MRLLRRVPPGILYSLYRQQQPAFPKFLKSKFLIKAQNVFTERINNNQLNADLVVQLDALPESADDKLSP